MFAIILIGVFMVGMVAIGIWRTFSGSRWNHRA